MIRDISNVVSRIRHWSRKRNHSTRSTWSVIATFLLWISANLGVLHLKWYRSMRSQKAAHSTKAFILSESRVAHNSSSEQSKREETFMTRKSAKFRGGDSHHKSGFPQIFDISPSRSEKKTGSMVFSILARRVQVIERYEIEQYPAEFSDNTQLYHIMDSSDIAIQETMELRDPYVQGECIPMKEWQTTFHPTCNVRNSRLPYLAYYAVCRAVPLFVLADHTLSERMRVEHVDARPSLWYTTTCHSLKTQESAPAYLLASNTLCYMQSRGSTHQSIGDEEARNGVHSQHPY
jgi:hypothetical protein